MGIVHAEITLKNAIDAGDVRRGHLTEQEVRGITIQALVVPGMREVLLGAIPLEDLDLVVDPVRQALTGAHGDEVLCMVK
jgi:hypothetical protein